MNQKPSLTQGNPGKSLLLFAFPMILGNLFQQFYNMADSMIVGNYVGESALAAVGASYALTTVFIMIAIGGGNGYSVLTSQYLGAGDYRRMKTSVYTSLLTFFAVSLVLGGIGLALNRTVLQVLQTPAEILPQAELYLGIYFVGLPFLFMYNVLASVFNALGESRIPLYLLIFSSLLNVVLDILSVTVLGMAVDGVAIATVISQGVAAIISFIILIRRLRRYPVKADSGKAPLFNARMLLRGTKIAIPNTLQQSIVSIGMLLVQSVVNGFGLAVVAGYSAGTRIESICIVPMIATGNAVATFTAQNIGAGEIARVQQGYRASYKIAAVFAVITGTVLFLFHEPMIARFLGSEHSAAAFETGTGYLSFIAYFFVCIGVKASVDGLLRGAGDVVVFTLANLVNLGIRVAGAFLLAPAIGVKAVWYVIPLGWTANYIISFSRYLTGKWKEKKMI